MKFYNKRLTSSLGVKVYQQSVIIKDSSILSFKLNNQEGIGKIFRKPENNMVTH